MPESLDRIELIDGEVIVAPSPAFWHQEVLRRVVFALGRWAEGQPHVTVAQAPLNVRFGPGRIMQPDAMVFLARIERGHLGPIDRPRKREDNPRATHEGDPARHRAGPRHRAVPKPSAQ